MTPRQTYGMAGTVTWVLFALAGAAMPLSDIAHLSRRHDAAASLEAAAAACMTVGILAACFWFDAMRRLKAGEPISVPNHYRAIGLVLFGFMTAVTFTNGFSPAAKPVLEFLQHCTPLVMSYLIWSVWKRNDVAPARKARG
jgi:drug/metabolite transporter (DMT)-like permease